MLFHSWAFLACALLFYPPYLWLARTRFRVPAIVLASYAFYACWSPWFPLLLGWVTTVDFASARMLRRSRRPALWLSASLGNTLSLLLIFKYGESLAGLATRALAAANIPFSPALPGAWLPIGLSFFALQSMGYVLDCYHRRIEPETSLARYAAFVSLFPLLLAGPIERAANLLPQLRGGSRVGARDVADGLSLVVVGLFKKIALADYLALYVDDVYLAPAAHASPALVAATVVYAWQIYFDFSGYSDMARGLARMLGLRVMANFEHPYLATGLGDFWRRWHISLSTWMRDYLFVPLYYRLAARLGSRDRRAAPADVVAFSAALAATFLVIGAWHGAGWTFVAWGGLHGLGRSVMRRLEASRAYRVRVPVWTKRLGVFAFVSVGWVLFRSATLADAGTVLSRIVVAGWSDPQVPVLMLLLIGAVFLYEAASESRARVVLAHPAVNVALAIVMILYLTVLSSATTRAFIYFQF